MLYCLCTASPGNRLPEHVTQQPLQNTWRYHADLPLFAKSDGSVSKVDAGRIGDAGLLQNVHWSAELGVGCWGLNIQTPMGWESQTIWPYALVDVCCPLTPWLWTLGFPHIMMLVVFGCFWLFFGFPGFHLRVGRLITNRLVVEFPPSFIALWRPRVWSLEWKGAPNKQYMHYNARACSMLPNTLALYRANLV